MTTNDPLPLLTIAELWAVDPHTPSVNYAKAELLKAYWEGEFPDGTVFVDTRQFFEVVFSDHDQNLANEERLMGVTRAQTAENLEDLDGAKFRQALRGVRDGLNDPAIMASYLFDTYSPKQRDLLDILMVLPSVLAAWCDRTGRQRPSFLEDPRYGSPQSKPTHPTREPGRPSSRTLYMAEFDRRAELGLTKPRVREEARELRTWLIGTHPGAPDTKVKTIENAIRLKHEVWRNWKTGQKPTE
jgi:hypothetical protein